MKKKIYRIKIGDTIMTDLLFIGINEEEVLGMVCKKIKVECLGVDNGSKYIAIDQNGKIAKHSK